MNIPNKLTVTRLVIAPFILFWFFAIDLIPGLSPVFYAAVLFVLLAVAELTDFFDGRIARKKNLVSDLGKVLDPFSDVVCHLTYFTCFLACGFMPVVCFILILWRELSQNFLRMLMMGKGKAMAANFFGKAKTCCYALCSFFGFVLRCCTVNALNFEWMNICMQVLCILSAAMSVLSFIIYVKNVISSKILASMSR